jgi:hypothetical protein
VTGGGGPASAKVRGLDGGASAKVRGPADGGASASAKAGRLAGGGATANGGASAGQDAVFDRPPAALNDRGAFTGQGGRCRVDGGAGAGVLVPEGAGAGVLVPEGVGAGRQVRGCRGVPVGAGSTARRPRSGFVPYVRIGIGQLSCPVITLVGFGFSLGLARGVPTECLASPWKGP